MTMAEVRDCKFLLDRSGRSWVNEEQISRAGYHDFHKISLLKVDDEEFYDVLGYSAKRKAFWVELIDPVKEVRAYIDRLGDSEPD